MKRGARTLMFQGTGSDVGKSVIVAGLCRLFTRRGFIVRPFKPQNMSNNAAVTPDGGEIGRAQALQARACTAPPSVDMNPVLLKPESDERAQIIVQGRAFRPAEAAAYQGLKATLLPAILESFARVRKDADLVLVEGAGSPAEMNLRQGDIANMGFAEAADVPVILVGDIDRGGVIASMVGTWELLPPAERRRIAGTVINKFRGDIRLFVGGRRIISEHTGWEDFGVVPFFPELGMLPSEDGIDLRRYDRKGEAAVRIAVPILPRISNFDDLDPLNAEPDVEVRMIEPGRPLPGDADLVILPGSKSTIADLRFVREIGWEVDLRAHLRRGGYLIGICGGYQMLGRTIEDAEGIEGPPQRIDGLGLLDVETRLASRKILSAVSGIELTTGKPVAGYEMHMGRTEGPGCQRPWLELDGRKDGAMSKDGRVFGCYVHGLFAADDFRRRFLTRLGARESSGASYEARVDQVLDSWAGHLEAHLNVKRLLDFARIPAESSVSARVPLAAKWSRRLPK